MYSRPPIASMHVTGTAHRSPRHTHTKSRMLSTSTLARFKIVPGERAPRADSVVQRHLSNSTHTLRAVELAKPTRAACHGAPYLAPRAANASWTASHQYHCTAKALATAAKASKAGDAREAASARGWTAAATTHPPTRGRCQCHRQTRRGRAAL
jgi:hypothetical protein